MDAPGSASRGRPGSRRPRRWRCGRIRTTPTRRRTPDGVIVGQVVADVQVGPVTEARCSALHVARRTRSGHEGVAAARHSGRNEHALIGCPVVPTVPGSGTMTGRIGAEPRRPLDDGNRGRLGCGCCSFPRTRELARGEASPARTCERVRLRRATAVLLGGSRGGCAPTLTQV